MSVPLALLHVEDTQSDSDLLIRLLQKAGYDLVYERVEEAEAMRASLALRRWDLIISDYNLPKFDGPAALKVLRESKQDIPFIVLSGTIGEETAVGEMKAGVSDYLLKGNLSRLVPSVQRELAQSAARRAAGMAQEALRKSESRYRELFRSAKDALFAFPMSPEGDVCPFSEANAVACEMLGYTIDELLRLTPLDIVASSHVERIRLSLASQVAGGVLNLFESVLMSKSAGEIPVEISSNFFRLEGERTMFFVVRDISERKYAAELLRESAERLQRTVNASKVGLWEWDLFLNTVHYSPECKRQLGFADGEIGDELREWISRLHPEDRGRAIAFAEQQIDKPGSDYRQEFRLRHKDGSYRSILAQGAFLVDDEGRSIRLSGTHIDVTDQKRLEERIQQSQKMESVGRLAGGIAHDFNNLLSVIIGYADLAMGTVPEYDPLRADIEQILRAGNRAAELTQQLLAFSRKQVLQMRVFNLNSVVLEAEKMLRRLIREDIELVFHSESALGNVKADPGQIEQVVMNLVVNARDSMPSRGTITLETCNVDVAEASLGQFEAPPPGRYVAVTVSDTGCGMDASTLRQVFEPFFTTKEMGKGTGLGLATVYGIINQSGGSVQVQSELGSGTTFKILLPRVEESVPIARVTDAQVPTSGEGVIFLAEDDDALRDFTSRILAGAGYTVVAAASGPEALSMIESEDRAVRLLITDVVMPRMSGPELADHVRRIGKCTKTLFVSGYAGDTVMRHGVIENSENFLCKPFTAKTLTRKVLELLNGK